MIRALAPKPSFIDEGAPDGVAASEVLALVNMGGGHHQPRHRRRTACRSSPGSSTSAPRRSRRRSCSTAPWPSKRPRRLRIQVGLAGEQPDEPGDLTPETMQEIHQVLDQACEAFADELRRSIDYYHTQEHVGEISKLILTGDGSLTRNIAFYLSQGLHLPVEIGNPLREVGENKTKLTEVQLEWMAPRLAIAIGLALDDEG